MMNGQKFMVAESAEEVIQKVNGAASPTCPRSWKPTTEVTQG